MGHFKHANQQQAFLEHVTPSVACACFVRGPRLLVDAVVHQQLRDQSGEERDRDPKPEATPRTVKRPPEAQGQGRQRQGELNVVGKIQFLVMQMLRNTYQGLTASDTQTPGPPPVCSLSPPTSCSRHKSRPGSSQRIVGDEGPVLKTPRHFSGVRGSNPQLDE